MHELEHKAFAIISKYGPLIARILIGGMFFMSGLAKLFDLAGTAGYISSVGLPAASFLALLAMLVEIVAGLGIVLGYHSRYSADVLILFTLAVTFFFHNFWAFEGQAGATQMIFFQKNLAIVGGLIYIMAFGAGPYSLGKKRRKSIESA